MKNIQIILNAILSKDIFEYILIDREFIITYASSGIKKYTSCTFQKGDEVFDICPELVGSEDKLKEILENPTLIYFLETIHKNDYYLNLSIEYYDANTLLILFHNITEATYRQQKLLQYSNESILLNKTLEKVLNNQNALLFITQSNEITYANEQFMEYFDIKRVADIKRKNLFIYKYFDDSLTSYDALFERVNNKEEYIVIKNDTFIMQAKTIEDTHKLFTLTKVTNLTKEIQTDSLTGAYNKRYFNSKIEHVLAHHEKAIIAVIDMDDFKKINDTYGHQIGDNVLVEFTNLVQDNIRIDDIFSRWGGEEFLLLLRNISLEDAMIKIEFIRTLIDAFTFTHIGHMTVSIGVAYTDEKDSVHTLLKRADEALYEAKSDGKNRVVFKKV